MVNPDTGIGGRDGTATESDRETEERFPRGEPPGPDRLPIIGNALPFFRQPFEFRTWVATTYGDVVDVSALGRRVYLVSHPDDIQQVLVTDDNRFIKPGFEKQFVSRAFGDSLSFINGEEWQRARQLYQPVFTMAKISHYAETMIERTTELIADWPDSGTITINEEMRKLTFSVLVRTLFGLDPSTVPDLRRDFEAVATKFQPANAIVPDWIPTPTNRRYERALARLEETIDDIVAERRRAESDGDDLLSVLTTVNAEQAATFSNERLRDEMMGFLFAGHETTAVALSFACYLLATHTAVQDRLRDEIETVLNGNGSGSRPTVESLQEFTHLDPVIDESLRLYPPNHIIPREPTEDVELGGYRIPEGSSVYCSQWVVHRDARWWDTPHQFQPNRWKSEPADTDADTDRPEYAYFPFGGGRRHCIGMRFARMEIRLALIQILSAFVLESVPSGEPTLAASLTLRPADPIKLTVRRRDQ